MQIDGRLGGGPSLSRARTAPPEPPDAASLARLARPGIIAAYDPNDALGWIELEGDRQRIRFGVGALANFSAKVGTAVRVLSVGVGYGGVPRATRVVPADYIEPPPVDAAAILRALRLAPELAHATWPETHAALVEAYCPASDPDDRKRAIDRDRALGVPEDTDSLHRAREALVSWLGEPIDAEDPTGHAADLLLIRDDHSQAPGTGPQLFELRGATGALYLMRTWSERLAIPGVEQLDLGTCFHPDTRAALSGIFRHGGLQPAFAAHAPGCAMCQRHLRDAAGDLPEEFLALQR